MHQRNHGRMLMQQKMVSGGCSQGRGMIGRSRTGEICRLGNSSDVGHIVKLIDTGIIGVGSSSSIVWSVASSVDTVVVGVVR